MEKFEVLILGCGSALPTLRHKPSSQLVNIRDKYYMIDCGEGTQTELRRNRIHLGRLSTIFISHLHGDHCFGLLGLISTLGLLGRTAPLHIYAPVDAEQLLRPQINYFCKNNPFEVEIHEVDVHAQDKVYEDRSVEVYTIPLKHRIKCCGYLFREKPLQPHIRREAIDKYEIPVAYIRLIKGGADYQLPDGRLIPNKELTEPAAPPRSYAYCSDTMYLPRITEQIAGVNLLYHEATFAAADKALAAKVYHSTTEEAAMIARQAHVGQLMIGHFSSRYEDEQQLLNEAQMVFQPVLLAREGLCVAVK
jgi:ribonuclease Z